MRFFQKELLKYAVVFLLIFSTDTFITFANSNEAVKRCFQLALVFVFVSCLARCRTMLPTKILIYAMMVLTIVGSMLVNNSFSGGDIIKLFLLSLGLVISTKLDFEDFKRIYVNLMTLICVWSLVLYLLTDFIIAHEGLFPIVTNIGNNRVAFFGFSNVCLKTYEFPRNYGPFWEPGVYAIYLCMALIFSLNVKKAITLREIILMVGVISTMSTAGLAVLFVIMFEYAYVQRVIDVKTGIKSRGSIWIKVTIMLFFVAILSVILLHDGIRMMLFAKLDRSNYQFMSASARLTSITGNIDIWLKNPIFGVGAEKLDKLYVEYLLERGYIANSNTNGLLIQFSMYGLLLGICGTYGLYKFADRLRQNKLSKFLIFVVLFMMMSAEPLTTSALFNTIIFYGIGQKDRQW